MQTHHQGHREVRYESVSRCCTYRACYLATRRSLAHHVGSILRFTLELHFLQLALEELDWFSDRSVSRHWFAWLFLLCRMRCEPWMRR